VHAGPREVRQIFTSARSEPSPQEVAADRISWQPTLTFLRYAIITIVTGAVSFVFVVVGFMPQHMGQAWGAMALAVVALVGAVLLRLQRYMAAVTWMASGVWLCVTGIALFHEGLRTPIFFVHPLIVFFLGWVVSARAALITAAITTASIVGFVLAPGLGWHPDTPQAPPILHAIIQVAVLLLSRRAAQHQHLG